MTSYTPQTTADQKCVECNKYHAGQWFWSTNTETSGFVHRIGSICPDCWRLLHEQQEGEKEQDATTKS